MAGRILVTGGAGFVGSYLVDALLQRGFNVRVYDSLSEQVHPTGIPDYLSSDVELVRADVRDIDQLRGAMRGVDVVYHFAAAVGVGQSMYEISNYMGVNTQGTANLLQVLLDTKIPIEKLIVASSMSIYGEGRYRCGKCGDVAPPVRDTGQLRARSWEPLCSTCGSTLAPVPTDESKPLQASSIYALSKKDQEEMTLLFGRTYGLPVVALRYFNIYGPRQALSNPYTGVAAIFASRLLNRRAPLIFEDGRQMRDFVSVHDITAANLLAMERHEADGRALNIGSGEPITIQQVADVLSNSLKTQIPAEVTGKYRAGDIRHCFADITAAKSLLGYAPRVSFADGVSELAHWLKQQTAEDRVAEAARQLGVFGLTA